MVRGGTHDNFTQVAGLRPGADALGKDRTAFRMTASGRVTAGGADSEEVAIEGACQAFP